MTELDAPQREANIRALLQRKGALRRYYTEVYQRYRACLGRTPPGGITLELGSGGGFVKEILDEVVTSDVIAYAGVDRVIDATAMPFEEGSLRAILMHNTFHHIADVGAFLTEAVRALKPGGRMLIVDQHPGIISTPVFKYLHGEPFDPTATWSFNSTGPLSDANGALAWIVFVRDRPQMQERFPELQLVSFRPHSPLTYWLAGGLKSWSLLPGWAYGGARLLDQTLTRISKHFASFVDIEIKRIG